MSAAVTTRSRAVVGSARVAGSAGQPTPAVALPASDRRIPRGEAGQTLSPPEDGRRRSTSRRTPPPASNTGCAAPAATEVRALGADNRACSSLSADAPAPTAPASATAPGPLSRGGPKGPNRIGQENVARVVAIVREAAEAGRACPTNKEIQAALGVATQQAACRILRRAANQGALVLTRERGWRVAVAPDGAWRTADAPEWHMQSAAERSARLRRQAALDQMLAPFVREVCARGLPAMPWLEMEIRTGVCDQLLRRSVIRVGAEVRRHKGGVVWRLNGADSLPSAAWRDGSFPAGLLAMLRTEGPHREQSVRALRIERRKRPVKAARVVRACLRCGEAFESSGPGNRLCRQCCNWIVGNDMPTYAVVGARVR